MKCLLIIAILFTLGNGLLPAQLPSDVRVSPPDSDSYVMPEDARIQSTAGIGDVRLVVWGTTANDDRDSLVNRLCFQMLRDTVPIGEQKMPHGAAARPYAFVKVIALADRFIILWDDKRPSAPGVYMRRVGLDGTFLDDERRIGTLPITGDTRQIMATLGDPNLGLALVWNHPSDDANRGLHAIEFDARGTVWRGEEDLGGWLTSILTYEKLPGLTLLVVSGNSSRVVHPDGQIDARSIPASRLAAPFYLDIDTSLAVISGHDLLFYDSAFDLLASRSVPLPALDSADSDMTLLTMDSLHRYVVYFAIVLTTPVDHTRYPPPSNSRRITYYRIGPIESDVPAPVKVYYINEARGIWDPVIYGYEGASRYVGCSNSALATAFFETVVYYDGDPTPATSTYVRFSLDQAGHFKLDGIPTEVTGFVGNCVMAEGARPERTSSVRWSAVRIIVSGHPIELRTPTGHFPINFMQARPGIANVGGELLTSWLLVGAEQLSVWDGAMLAAPLDLRSVPGFSQRSAGQNETYRGSQNESMDTIASFNGSLISCALYRHHLDYFDYQASPKTVQPREYYNTRAALSIARPEGWRTSVDVTTSATSWTWDQCHAESYGWNPNRAELIAYGEVIGPPFTISEFSALAFDTSGAFLWSIPLANRPDALVPIDFGRVLAMRGTAFEQRSDSGVERTGLLPAVAGTVGYMRLFGQWFLRYAVSAGTCTIDRFALDATRDTSLLLNTAVSDPFFLQDPSDSTILLLYVHNGVRLTRLTRHLRILFQDSLISAAQSSVSHPAGALRGDTLFVVWEDARNIGLDIYGNRMRIETVRDTSTLDTSTVAGVGSPEAPSGAAAPALVRLYPNPARDAVRIEYRSSKECDLEVVDRLGRVLRRVTAPANPEGSVDLSTSALESGIYLVRLRSADATSVARLVVVR